MHQWLQPIADSHRRLGGWECRLNCSPWRGRNRGLPYPGDFIRTELVEPAGLSVTAAAKALQVSRPTLSSLLNSKADLSGEMALRLEKAFGVKMVTLMRMQVSYSIAQIRKRAKYVDVRRLALTAVHS